MITTARPDPWWPFRREGHTLEVHRSPARGQVVDLAHQHAMQEVIDDHLSEHVLKSEAVKCPFGVAKLSGTLQYFEIKE